MRCKANLARPKPSAISCALRCNWRYAQCSEVCSISKMQGVWQARRYRLTVSAAHSAPPVPESHLRVRGGNTCPVVTHGTMYAKPGGATRPPCDWRCSHTVLGSATGCGQFDTTPRAASQTSRLRTRATSPAMLASASARPLCCCALQRPHRAVLPHAIQCCARLSGI